MIPILSSIAGLVALKCPACGRVQMRGRREVQLSCKDCGQGFSARQGRETLREAKARAKARSRNRRS